MHAKHRAPGGASVKRFGGPKWIRGSYVYEGYVNDICLPQMPHFLNRVKKANPMALMPALYIFFAAALLLPLSACTIAPPRAATPQATPTRPTPKGTTSSTKLVAEPIDKGKKQDGDWVLMSFVPSSNMGMLSAVARVKYIGEGTKSTLITITYVNANDEPVAVFTGGANNVAAGKTATVTMLQTMPGVDKVPNTDYDMQAL